MDDLPDICGTPKAVHNDDNNDGDHLIFIGDVEDDDDGRHIFDKYVMKKIMTSRKVVDYSGQILQRQLYISWSHAGDPVSWEPEEMIAKQASVRGKYAYWRRRHLEGVTPEKLVSSLADLSNRTPPTWSDSTWSGLKRKVRNRDADYAPPRAKRRLLPMRKSIMNLVVKTDDAVPVPERIEADHEVVDMEIVPMEKGDEKAAAIVHVLLDDADAGTDPAMKALETDEAADGPHPEPNAAPGNCLNCGQNGHLLRTCPMMVVAEQEMSSSRAAAAAAIDALRVAVNLVIEEGGGGQLRGGASGSRGSRRPQREYTDENKAEEPNANVNEVKPDENQVENTNVEAEQKTNDENVVNAGEEGKEKPEEKENEEQVPRGKTLEEYRAEMNQKIVEVVQFNTREAGEGDDQKIYQKLVPLKKSEQNKQEEEDAQVVAEDAVAENASPAEADVTARPKPRNCANKWMAAVPVGGQNKRTSGVFTTYESEKQQLIQLRQYYIDERGVEGIDRTGPDDIFENLKELLAVSKATLEKIANEKEVELLLNSLFSLFISFKEDQPAELVKLYCQLLTEENFRGQGWNSLAGIAVRLLSSIFRLHVHLPTLQFVELNSLIQMAGRARLTQFLDIGMPQIDEFAKRWNLDIEKHRELYRTLHAALCRDERHEQAAEVMATLLKTYTQTDANKAREDARECVRTAVVDPKAFYFDHLLDLSAVKSLEQTDPLMHKVLNIFVNHGLAQFRQFSAENPAFVQDQLKVDAQVLEKKIKMLNLISMAEKKQVLSLAELSKQLDIPDEEQLEEFLIDAIRAEAISGRIDDLNGRLEVTFHQQECAFDGGCGADALLMEDAAADDANKHLEGKALADADSAMMEIAAAPNRFDKPNAHEMVPNGADAMCLAKAANEQQGAAELPAERALIAENKVSRKSGNKKRKRRAIARRVAAAGAAE